MIARKLIEHASCEDISIDMSPYPARTADVNHFIPWWAAHGHLGQGASLLMMTHIDPNERREAMALELCQQATMITTMSMVTRDRLIGWGIPEEKLVVAHVGVDEDWQPRLILIGCSYRVYRDGRKREGFLVDLADQMDLSPFKFVIIGTGWGWVVEALRKRNIQVEWHNTEDYQVHKTIIPQLDYWLYTAAWDEGPLGMLDALRCGIPCILPRQGYCLDAALHSYFYTDLAELKQAFGQIKAERWRHREAIDEWTWPNYSRLHQELYRRLVNG